MLRKLFLNLSDFLLQEKINKSKKEPTKKKLTRIFLPIISIAARTTGTGGLSATA
jgi:hypothetical protein